MNFNYKLESKNKQKNIFFLNFTLAFNNYESTEFDHYHFYFENKNNLNNLIREVLIFEYFSRQYGLIFKADKFLENKKFIWLQIPLNDFTYDRLEKSSLSSFDFYYIDKSSVEYILNIDRNDIVKFREKLKIIANDLQKEQQQQLKEKIDYKIREQHLNILLFNKLNSLLDEENINDKLHNSKNKKYQKL